ncbi:MAG: DsbA family protein [Candidatus Omnitrophica bacterium]|nr:DsbA family protein [Candidatus Omnitrophota bacterium]
MKEILRAALFCLAFIIAAHLIGDSMVKSANIIGDSLKAPQEDTSVKVITELVKALKESAPAGSPFPPQAPEAPPAPGSVKVEGVTFGTNPIKGNAQAPVTLIEFSDFQCPYTKRFFQQSFPQIEKEYIDTGKLKFAYRDFPLGFHPFAKPAAIAARCAGAQGQYWQMFDKLLSDETLDQGSFDKYAEGLGLDTEAFSACRNDPQVAKAVESDIEDATKFGVQGTPSFFINGRYINGAYPFELFQQIIEEELKEDSEASPENS